MSDEMANALGEMERLMAENEHLQALLNAPPYVDCICGGCPRKVPQAWASGMCQPCVDEDCEHTDGALEVEARARELAAEVERLRGANDRLAAERDRRANAERDRLRGVLEETHKEFRRRFGGHPLQNEIWEAESREARDFDDYLRARAGLEPTPPLCGSEADDAAHYAYRKEGAAEERLAVLAWLRGRAGNNPSPVSLAAAIERGEHRSARAELEQPTETERKAKAFDNVRALWWEFCDVEEGRAALRCLGEFIGEWEHHHERRRGAEAISDAAVAVAERMLAPVFASVAGPTYASVKDLEAAGVKHRQQDVSANAQPAGVAAAPSGQAGGGQSASAGSPAGPAICTCATAYRSDVCPNCGGVVLTRQRQPDPLSIPPGTPTSAMLVMGPAARELLRAPGGVTPEELLKAGFPDVAARLAGAPPAGLACPNHPEHLCVSMAARNGLCVYGCAIDNGHPPLGIDPAAPGADRHVEAHVEVGPAGLRLTCERCGLVFCHCGVD